MSQNMPQMERIKLTTSEVEMVGLSNVNILLGRNGSGKSRFLRFLDSGLTSSPEFNVRYISPERAGIFKKDGNIQNNIENDKTWLRSVRVKNQADNFKAASANFLRELEIMYLRRLQDSAELRRDPDRNFRTDRLDAINRLLTNVSVEQQQQHADFVFRSSSGDEVPPDQISSGESEAVALACEIMYFFETLDSSRFNLLLLDEPDVHLHPDLQARLAKFILRKVEELSAEFRPKVAICIATHSTALVCALAPSDYTSIGTKDFGVEKVQQFAATDQLKKVAPFFGHPLSLSLSNDALLILEGEDDERVWQQAARSSQGRIRLFPVLASSVNQQSELETFCAQLLNTLYDSPLAYSLRDGDGVAADLEPNGPVVRFRLHCYAIENALLTEECLSLLQTTWPKFQESAKAWIAKNHGHRDIALIQQLVESVDRMRNQKIKKIRQLICAIAGFTKPWEMFVGQAIGALNPASLDDSPATLTDFIGGNAIIALLGNSGR
jgi:energy-coupling factor transporter ATP-binding protein EcfA2